MAASHRLKLQRALEHLYALQSASHLWAETDPCVITSECDVNTRKHTLTCRVLRQPTGPRIPLLVGDCAHNLRQALDHLAYALAVRVHGCDPPPNAGTTMFPIRDPSDPPTAFRDSITRYVGPKKRMPAGMYATLEDFQPYKGGNRLLLHLLNEIDRLDKHRFLPIVAGVLQIPDINFGSATGGVKIGNFIHAQEVSDVRIADHLALGAFEDGQIIIEAGDEMDMYMALTASIAFDKGFAAAPGELVIPLLRGVRELIRIEVFPALERFL